MLFTTRTTFPKGLTVSVPCYQIDRFNGRNVELTPQDQQLEVDFARFDARSIANATGVQREGWEIRGLIALDSWSFAHALKTVVLPESGWGRLTLTRRDRPETAAATVSP